MKIAVVGAGFSGAVIAREFAQAGHDVDVFEKRAHVAGNCHTARDHMTGVMVHTYGPHIFHTANERVWKYIQQFGEMVRYDHHVMAVAGGEMVPYDAHPSRDPLMTARGGQIYSMPINLHTINQFFGKTFSPEEARRYIKWRAELNQSDTPAVSFADQARRMVGDELYEAFLRGYTIKQWGRQPEEIPASVLKRLPLRFNYDARYFDHPYQAIPRNGYTAIVVNILLAKGVKVYLNTPFTRAMAEKYHHVFYSGPLDAWYNYAYGRLSYRTLDFTVGWHFGDVLGCPVLNYCDEKIPHTRVTEFKHFTAWETHERSVTYTERSREAGPDDEPYYPVRLVNDKATLSEYELRAASDRDKVTFIGRLGTYRYLDMDTTIAEALQTADEFLSRATTAD